MFTDRLAQLRKAKKWSLQYTADRLGIAKSTYAGYESGYRQPPLDAVHQLADLFNTSVDYLIGRHDHPFPEANPTLELTEELPANTFVSIDGVPLSNSEINQCIAFIRTIRSFTE